MFVLRIISLGVFISLYRGVDGIKWCRDQDLRQVFGTRNVISDSERTKQLCEGTFGFRQRGINSSHIGKLVTGSTWRESTRKLGN